MRCLVRVGKPGVSNAAENQHVAAVQHRVPLSGFGTVADKIAHTAALMIDLIVVPVRSQLYLSFARR